MITKNWAHQNVNKKGSLKAGGAVEIKKGVYSSLLHNCSIQSCKCQKKLWLSINFGYNTKKKSVSGKTFYFDNSIELTMFLKTNKYFG